MDNTEKPEKKPDEQAVLNMQAKIKIFDPETQEIIIEQRA